MVRSAAKLENGWDISGTILIKFLIKSNSVTFKRHFPYPQCIASFSSRIETKSFPSSFLQLFPLGQKKHIPSHQYHPTSSRFARKTDCLDGRRKLRDRSSGPLFAFSTQCQRHPRKNHPGALLIIYPGRSWITPTVGHTQLINSPVTIHLALSRPRVFHGPVSFLPLSLQL